MIPLEKPCVSLELAKRLKELGVKQESLLYWFIDLRAEIPRLLDLRDLNRYSVAMKFNDFYSAFTVAELDEMYQALTTGRPVRHDGRWGTATLEVVLAIMQLTREHREIMLSRQCDAY